MVKSSIGSLGEEIACKYLKNREFSILQRNYWEPQGEIDIIAKKNDIIHFIEVKSVNWDFNRKDYKNRGIAPEENLHKNKLKRLFRATQIYLIKQNIPEDALWQIDALFVFIDSKSRKSSIEYYEHISLE